jgi:hypothetical protein
MQQIYMSNLKTRQKINSQPITKGWYNAGYQRIRKLTVSIQLPHRGTMTMFQSPALYQPPAVSSNINEKRGRSNFQVGYQLF